MSRILIPIAIVLAVFAASCGGGSEATSETGQAEGRSSLPRGSEPVSLDPSEFTSQIDHPYWPLKEGSRWVYRETDAEGAEMRVVVTVTGDTRTIMGIEARVVHDLVTEGGETVEDTYDWYAQDAAGNIWYLGENTKEYENGKVTSTKGSWEAGVDGAQAGVILPADPHVGMTYREEYYEGEAEDAATVLSLDEKVQVPFASFERVLMTKNFTPLDPKMLEHKFYARGVGLVMALTLSGGSDREELVRYEAAP